MTTLTEKELREQLGDAERRLARWAKEVDDEKRLIADIKRELGVPAWHDTDDTSQCSMGDAVLIVHRESDTSSAWNWVVRRARVEAKSHEWDRDRAKARAAEVARALLTIGDAR